MPQLPPISVLAELRDLDSNLIALLRGLTPSDWHLPTTARPWAVKDVAAHLLDGNLRALSLLRDGYAGDPPGEIRSYADLLAYLNRLNAEWVQAARRLSPAVLTDLLERTGNEYCDYLDTLDPDAPAAFSVAWAGETESANWFHLAREYTEKWHHQQQIRLATGRGADELFSKNLFTPLIDTLLRALPHHYRDVPGYDGDLLRVTITGEGGGDWFLAREAGAWHLSRTATDDATATVELPDRFAWRVFMKSIAPEEARPLLRFSGDSRLTEPLLSLRAVMG